MADKLGWATLLVTAGLGAAGIFVILKQASAQTPQNLALWLSTDKDVYSPWEIMTITVQAFDSLSLTGIAGISVTLILNGVPQKFVVSGAGGYITTTLRAPRGAGSHVLTAQAGTAIASVGFSVF